MKGSEESIGGFPGGLQHSLKDFQEAINKSSIVSMADKRGIITHVNENFIFISGFAKEELIGQNHRIVNSGFHPRSFWVNMWQTISSGKIWRAEVKNKAKDGSFYWVDTFIMPFLDKEGRVREFLSIRNDITQRKAQEESIIQLNQSLADFQNAIQLSSIVSRADKRGLITYVNENFVKISGYSSQELIGQNHRIVNSSFHPRSFWADMWKTISSGKIWRAEVKNKSKDGTFYWVDTFIMPFLDEDSRPREFLSIRNDITSRKQSEEALSISREKAELANRAKSEFLANMSHEIRTPLNAIIGFTDLLMKTYLSPVQEQYLSTVNQSATSLLDIVNSILDFSKIEAGKMELAFEWVNLQSLGEQVMEMFKLQAIQKNIKLVCSYDVDLPTHASVDPIRLRQVLVNLLGNALKFTEAGRIELSIEQVSTHVSDTNKAITTFRFSVADTGVGILEENQRKIFEAFSQEDLSVTKKYGGTGLGLAISNKLLRLMGSHLKLQSSRGTGSIFFFDIDLETETEDTQQFEASAAKQLLARIPPEENKITNREIKILIAEDNFVNMSLTKAIIMNIAPNATLLEAYNGREAVEKYQFQPDLVFMDIQMPEMNGYEATRLIRKIEEKNKQSQATRIIALTAAAVDTEREKCLNVGMNGFLTKPIDAVKINQILLEHDQTTGPNLYQSQNDFDYNVLLALLGGKEDQANHILKLFLEHTPITLQEMKLLIEQRAWQQLSIKLHSLKSHYDYLGNSRLKQRIEFWEQQLREGNLEFDHAAEFENLERATTSILAQIEQTLGHQ